MSRGKWGSGAGVTTEIGCDFSMGIFERVDGTFQGFHRLQRCGNRAGGAVSTQNASQTTSTELAQSGNRRTPLFETLGRDVRYAVRTLWRDKGFAAFAILIVGLGVGASCTDFQRSEYVADSTAAVSRSWEAGVDGESHRCDGRHVGEDDAGRLFAGLSGA